MDDPMKDKDMPNRASNMEKAEGDRAEGSSGRGKDNDNRWTSDPDTIERSDRDRLEGGAKAEPAGGKNRDEIPG
jgi:hypothetical protein